MRPLLPDAFLKRPIAHRALHDVSAGRPENSRAAVEAAAAAGFGIEIDVQGSSDNVAMVFHDYSLDRLTDRQGPISAVDADTLQGIELRHGDEGIPTLTEILGLVAGRVPLLIEIKDQDGALGDDVGPLEVAVSRALTRYSGDVAVMSFNPHSVSAMQALEPDVPRGLTTCDFDPTEWAAPEARLEALRAIRDFERVGASFISHDARDLDRDAVTALHRKGVPVLCWTIRSPNEERAARRIADNVTFEGYLPA